MQAFSPRTKAIERILCADKDLRPWLPEIIAIYGKAARRLPPLISDSVSL